MSIYRENETPEQRVARLAAKAAADQAAKNNGNNIRCGSGQGFVSKETRPDGTKVERYHYGREGD